MEMEDLILDSLTKKTKTWEIYFNIFNSCLLICCHSIETRQNPNMEKLRESHCTQHTPHERPSRLWYCCLRLVVFQEGLNILTNLIRAWADRGAGSPQYHKLVKGYLVREFLFLWQPSVWIPYEWGVDRYTDRYDPTKHKLTCLLENCVHGLGWTISWDLSGNFLLCFIFSINKMIRR